MRIFIYLVLVCPLFASAAVNESRVKARESFIGHFLDEARASINLGLESSLEGLSANTNDNSSDFLVALDLKKTMKYGSAGSRLSSTGEIRENNEAQVDPIVVWWQAKNFIIGSEINFVPKVMYYKDLYQSPDMAKISIQLSPKYLDNKKLKIFFLSEIKNHTYGPQISDDGNSYTKYALSQKIIFNYQWTDKFSMSLSVGQEDVKKYGSENLRSQNFEERMTYKVNSNWQFALSHKSDVVRGTTEFSYSSIF